MNYQHLVRWGILVIFGISLVSGCTPVTPTPIVQIPAAPPVSAPSLPTAAQQAPTEPPTEAPAAATTTTTPAEGTAGAANPEGTGTIAVTSTKGNPVEMPFLMKIDRVSVVVGRGTLLEGRVTNGTLQQNGGVEILGPQNQSMSASALATLVSGIARDQVTAGDYAGILVEGVDATKVTPGMLLSEAEAYPTYEEALQALQ
jgi:hypothetical protein